MKKRGATLLQFTHHPSAILYAATKPEYKGPCRAPTPGASRSHGRLTSSLRPPPAITRAGYIQYHSLHDNKLLRVFQGHTDAYVVRMHAVRVRRSSSLSTSHTLPASCHCASARSRTGSCQRRLTRRCEYGTCVKPTAR